MIMKLIMVMAVSHEFFLLRENNKVEFAKSRQTDR